MSIRPEDVLPDGDDRGIIGGRNVRKGTILSFVRNIEIMENPNTTNKERSEAIEMLNILAPDVISVSLHKHVVFKNEKVEAILNKADIKNKD